MPLAREDAASPTARFSGTNLASVMESTEPLTLPLLDVGIKAFLLICLVSFLLISSPYRWETEGGGVPPLLPVGSPSLPLPALPRQPLLPGDTLPLACRPACQGMLSPGRGQLDCLNLASQGWPVVWLPLLPSGRAMV